MITSLLFGTLLILVVINAFMFMQVSSLTKDVGFLAQEIDYIFDQIEEGPHDGTSLEGSIDLVRLADGLGNESVSGPSEKGDSEVH